MEELQEILQNKIEEYKKIMPIQKELKKYKVKPKIKAGIKMEEYCIDVSHDIKNKVNDIAQEIKNFIKDYSTIYLMIGNDFLEEDFFICRIKINNGLEITEYSFPEEIIDFKNHDNFKNFYFITIKLIKTKECDYFE